jgi:hypothetical protein
MRLILVILLSVSCVGFKAFASESKKPPEIKKVVEPGGDLVNCEFLSGPLKELKETVTGKDVSVAVAECERPDGVEVITLVYGSPSKCEDATVCANDESIPKLKMVSPPVEPLVPPSLPKGGSSK